MRVSRVELLRLLRGRLPSADELEAVRVRRLRALVHHAYDQVPYYRRMFESAGLGPEDIRRPEDLRHLPVSSREALRAAGEDRLARDADPASGIFVTTSGSTGKPFPVYYTRHEDRLRRALDLRSIVELEEDTAILPAFLVPATRSWRIRKPVPPSSGLGGWRVSEFSATAKEP